MKRRMAALARFIYRNRVYTKSISFILSLVLIFYVIPSTIYAKAAEAIQGINDANDEIATVTDISSCADENTNTQTVLDGKIFEAIELREENVKHFRLSDGTYIAAQYNYPIHSLDVNGVWQDIDNALSESGSEFSNSDARIKFAKKITGNDTLFTLHDGNSKITLSLIGATKGTVGEVTNNEDTESDTELQKMMNLEKISSSVIYEDILDGVDVEYVVHSKNVKENIIVKEKKDTYFYSFELKVNGLTAVLTDSGDIELRDNTTDELKYIIPAPVVYDSVGNYAPYGVAEYTLNHENGGKYILGVSVNAEWMNSESRVFPVTIDPTIKAPYPRVLDTYIDSSNPSYSGEESDYLYVSNGKISYWKCSQMPEVPVSAFITEARIALTATTYTNTIGYVGVYEVVSSWSDSLTWNEYSTSNSGALSSVATDYCNINGAGIYYFDVTKTVFKWYSERQGWYFDQYGLAFAQVSEYSANAQFYSNDYESSQPTLTISYVDMKGIEAYWPYSSHSTKAGAGSINLANGNLVFAIPTLTTTDSLFGYTPTLVYNSFICNKKYYQSTDTQTGYFSSSTARGFKISACETIIERIVNIDSETTLHYYVYTDSDGTEHELHETSIEGIYKDIDGLGLTLTVESSSLELSDDTKTVRRFSPISTPATNLSDSNWYLAEIEDISGNKLVFEVDTDYRPTAVKIQPNGATSATEMLKLLYTPDGTLCAVYNPTSKHSVIMRYSSSYSASISYSTCNYLRKVQYCYGTDSVTEADIFSFATSNNSNSNITVYDTNEYNYDSEGRLFEVKNISSGMTLRYEYDGCRVIKVSEYAGNTLGQELEITYGVGYSEVCTTGNDEVLGTEDDTLTRYVFDNYGRAISVYSASSSGNEIYGATQIYYETQENVKNNVEKKIAIGGSSVNQLINGGFENGTAPWSISNNVAHVSEFTFEGEGMSCIKFSPSVTESAYAKQRVKLRNGNYTLSMLISAENCSDYSGYVKIVGVDTSNIIHSEEISLNIITDFGEVTCFATSFSVDSSSEFTTVDVVIEFTTSAVSADAVIQIDRVMLNSNLGSADYSLIKYGAFDENVINNDQSLYSLSSVWSGATVVTDDSPFNNTLKINAEGLSKETVKQRVFEATAQDLTNFDQTYNNEGGNNHGYEYIVSGFAKAVDVISHSDAYFRITVDVVYYQGSEYVDVTKTYNFDFVSSCDEWQFVCGHVPTKLENAGGVKYNCIRYIDVKCEVYGYLQGYVLFDDISLIYATGDNVAKNGYDEEGNLVSVKTYAFEEYYYYNSNNDIIQKINNQNELTEYEYVSDRPGLVSSVTDYTYSFDESASEYILGDSTIRIDKDPKSKTVYTYDSYGLCTSMKVIQYNSSGNEIDEYIEERYSYITDIGSKIFGALRSSENSLRKKTWYGYDEKTGLLHFIAYPDGYATVYTYDSAGKLTNVSPGGYTSSTEELLTYTSSDIDYVYDSNNLLQKIVTASAEYNITYNAYGSEAGISVGETELASYEYNDNNGKLNKITYGNGFSVEYVYNALEMLDEVWYNYSDGSRELVCEYEYTSNGEIAKIIDNLSGKTSVYRYDINGRLISSGCYDNGEYELFSMYSYDELSRLSMYITKIGCIPGVDYVSLAYVYTYNFDGTLNSLLVNDTASIRTGVSYTYDNLNRLTGTTVSYPSSNPSFTNEVTYGYEKVDTRGSYYIDEYISKVNGTVTSQYTYEYNSVGNISKITDKNGKSISYSYDSLYSLTLVQDEIDNKEYVYRYDSAGNITSIETRAITDSTPGGGSDDDTPNEYAVSFPLIPPSTTVTVEFGYTNSEWGDLLTSYDGVSITYDNIGNPLSYYNGSSYTFTWQGRRLMTAAKGTNTMSFEYNSDGLRISKTVNGVTTNYIYDGDLLVAEYTDTKIIIYIYDAYGSPVGFKYRASTYTQGVWDMYYYEKNLQGDIVAVYSSNGTKLVSYKYNAWGVTTKSYANNGSSTTATYNNLTYRGYYYDSDLGMYYLQSRYYDPVVCRFINADSALYGTLQGYNLFLYCENNPVTRVDYNGDMWQFVPALDPRNMLYGEGGSNGLFGCHLGYNYSGSYDSSAYGTYVIKTNTAYADARLGGYYFSGGGYIGGFTGQYATGGTVSVTDSMAVRSGTSQGKGFASFEKLKKYLGSAGQGNDWHHIVEQSQIQRSGFTPQMIHNTNNIVPVNRNIHHKISGYYSSKLSFTNGLTVRDWLAGQSFEAQYNFGIGVYLEILGEN